MVAVLSSTGTRLMPTSSFKARKLLNRGRAKIEATAYRSFFYHCHVYGICFGKVFFADNTFGSKKRTDRNKSVRPLRVLSGV